MDGSDIVKQILLRESGVFAEAALHLLFESGARQSVEPVELAAHSLDPNVNSKRASVKTREKRNSARDLFANARKRQQCLI